MTATGMATSTGAALGNRVMFPADRPWLRSTMSPPIEAATSAAYAMRGLAPAEAARLAAAIDEITRTITGTYAG